jgi:hypothetical protein
MDGNCYDATIKIGRSFYLEGALVMSLDTLLKIREMGREIKRERRS